MRRALLLALLSVAAACARPPVQDEVTIEFPAEGDAVLVTAETKFELNPRNNDIRKRVDTAREAAVSGTDAWSVRFGRLTPETERVTFQRQRGALETVTRFVRIPSDDLPRVFSDAAITINVMRGDGWRELAMYPGTSSRATREQQKRFDEALSAWSADVARYFTAVRHLYTYLDEQPGRAKYAFGAILSNEEAQAGVTEDEAPLVEAVIDAMVKIADRMDQQDARAESFAESADLMFNPFPARMTIRVPGEVLAVEGFEKAEKELVIEPVDLFKAVAALEGRWISPDPLAALLRDEAAKADEIAELPRHAVPVTSSSDVTAALREKLARPRAYVVRWRD